MSKILLALVATFLCTSIYAQEEQFVFKAGHPSLKEFILPPVPYPSDNKPNSDREKLGKTLFFDPRISGDGNASCATCHNPGLAWTDGLPTAKGAKSVILDRKSPTIFNAAYHTELMWDGRKKSLEDQASGPMEAPTEMNADMTRLLASLNTISGYKKMFAKAYPGEPINEDTVTKAIATFERTIVSKNSPFDKWVKGDSKALTKQQVKGFELFVGKGNCLDCHSGATFSDNGYHNIGLASYGRENPDLGRYAIKAVDSRKGAFKTPTLREISRRAPYFHDGSVKTLEEVIEHYNKGGEVTTNLDKAIKPLNLTNDEKKAIVAFLESLTSPFVAVALPELPK